MDHVASRSSLFFCHARQYCTQHQDAALVDESLHMQADSPLCMHNSWQRVYKNCKHDRLAWQQQQLQHHASTSDNRQSRQAGLLA